MTSAACDSTPSRPIGSGGGGNRRDASQVDAASGRDAEARRDAGEARDGGFAEDVSQPRDALPGDAPAIDGGARDSGGLDAGARDATTPADAGVRRGTCQSSADCNGRACVPVPADPSGWHTCLLDRPTESMACHGPPANDQCCVTSDCSTGGGAGGRCYEGPLWYCGGPPPIDSNVCVPDECAADNDCPASRTSLGTCVPAGAFGEHGSRCVAGDCRFDGDCNRRNSGRCMPFFNPCRHRFLGFYCTYADSRCDEDDDCPDNGGAGYCAPGSDGMTSCQVFIPPP